MAATWRLRRLSSLSKLCALLFLCLSLPAILSQNSPDINVDDTLSANVMVEQEIADDSAAQDPNETGLDENELEDSAGLQNDQDLGIPEQAEEKEEGGGGGRGEGGGGEGGEASDVQEEAAKEALADAADKLLPEVIEETEEEKKNFAQILEIDQTAERKLQHDGDYHHPFHRPNIVEDVHYTYRRFQKMKLIRHGKFWMGTNDPKSETGEYPLREIPVRSFYLDIHPVINAFYWAFRAQKRFVRSEAEVKGWSWVTEHVVSKETREKYSTEGPKGWLAVKKARWDRPEGPDSNLDDRWTHPVVHVSWYDAKQFCNFHGKRLPTEQEWEYAARAGLVAEEYPWGDRWERRRANTWQGRWPDGNLEADGYRSTSPVDAYRPQNYIGLYDMIGNVWEWTHSRYYERLISRDLQGQMHTLKGGSFVDSIDGEVNLPVRNGQRSGQAPDYTASNVGFRCARSAPEVDPKRLKVGLNMTRKVTPTPKTKPRVPKIYRKPKTSRDEL